MHSICLFGAGWDPSGDESGFYWSLNQLLTAFIVGVTIYSTYLWSLAITPNTPKTVSSLLAYNFDIVRISK